MYDIKYNLLNVDTNTNIVKGTFTTTRWFLVKFTYFYVLFVYTKKLKFKYFGNKLWLI
jgi:hypothetical protein